MAKVGRTVDNTIAKTPITFAMIELAESPDCNDRKQTWLNYGFKDVTPRYASQSTVPSLNGSKVADGRLMLKDMEAIDADWFMISGHQGALFQSDYNLYSTDGKPVQEDMSNLDVAKLYDTQDFCGFFNEAYHSGRWENSTRADPTPAAISASLKANELYLRTTATAPSAIAPFPQNNAFMDPPRTGAKRVSPKGVITSACNTLIYRSTRVTWSSAFPNAVIFGTMDRIASGTWVTNAIASAALTDETFWRDPQSVLDQTGKCEELIKQLAKGFPRDKNIGLIYKGQLYVANRKDYWTIPAADKAYTP